MDFKYTRNFELVGTYLRKYTPGNSTLESTFTKCTCTF